MGVVGWLNQNAGAVTALATVALVACTVGLWVATHRLWKSGKQQIAVATSAVDNARESAERELRAYVFVESAEIVDFALTEGHTPRVDLAVHNSGKTPAHHLRLTFDGAFGSIPLPLDQKMEPRNIGPNDDDLPLPPGGTVTRSFPIGPLTGRQIGLLKGRQATFYVFGMISYRDAFDRSRETRFRSMSAGHTTVKSGVLKLIACEGGNSAT